MVWLRRSGPDFAARALQNPWHTNSHSINGHEGRKAPQGCCNKGPQAGGLKTMKWILSQLWRPEVKVRGVLIPAGISEGGSLSGLSPAPGGHQPSFLFLAGRRRTAATSAPKSLGLLCGSPLCLSPISLSFFSRGHQSLDLGPPTLQFRKNLSQMFNSIISATSLTNLC